EAQIRAGVYSGEAVRVKALEDLRASECGHGPSAAVDALPIRALAAVSHTQVVMPSHLEAEMPTRGGEGEHTLADGNGLIILPHPKSIGTQKEGYLPQPLGVAQALSELFGFVHYRGDPPEFT